MISVYADGSSTGRADKPGGWAYVVIKDGLPLIANYGGDKSTTNNKMELQAAIEGLKAVINNNWHKDNIIELVSDSEYTLKIANSTYHPQKNMAQCVELVHLFTICQARIRHVYGHTGDTWNERCDSLSKQGKEEVTAAIQP